MVGADYKTALEKVSVLGWYRFQENRGHGDTPPFFYPPLFIVVFSQSLSTILRFGSGGLFVKMGFGGGAYSGGEVIWEWGHIRSFTVCPNV